MTSAGPDFSTTIDLLTAPFVKLREDGLDKTARLKADELLGDPRLDLEAAMEDKDEDQNEDNDDDAGDEEWNGIN